MKGISTWFLVLAGLLAAGILLYSAVFLFSNLIVSSMKQNAISDYHELVTEINDACIHEIGFRQTKRIGFSDTVNAFFVNNESSREPLEDAEKLILNKESAQGRFFCVQFNPLGSEVPRCSEIDCLVELDYFGSVNPRFDILGMVDEILGSKPVFRYNIQIERKSANIVEVTAERAA